MAECVFCRIVQGQSPASWVHRWGNVAAFEPLSPVTPGHVLVVPKDHVEDFTVDPLVSAEVMHCAAELARPPCNLITSAGRVASQSVFHLHVHIVPRRRGDGLRLPWSRPS